MKTLLCTLLLGVIMMVPAVASAQPFRNPIQRPIVIGNRNWNYNYNRYGWNRYYYPPVIAVPVPVVPPPPYFDAFGMPLVAPYGFYRDSFNRVVPNGYRYNAFGSLVPNF